MNDKLWHYAIPRALNKLIFSPIYTALFLKRNMAIPLKFPEL